MCTLLSSNHLDYVMLYILHFSFSNISNTRRSEHLETLEKYKAKIIFEYHRQAFTVLFDYIIYLNGIIFVRVWCSRGQTLFVLLVAKLKVYVWTSLGDLIGVLYCHFVLTHINKVVCDITKCFIFVSTSFYH